MKQKLITDAWCQEAISTAAIEGERSNLAAVRSSIGRRLTGIAPNGAATPRHIDGLVDIMDDAVNNADAPLTHERLQGWQAPLFPTGFSGMLAIRVGAYRNHVEPMQIIGGRAMIDLQLARDSENLKIEIGAIRQSRVIRISQRLLEMRSAYYDELHHAQHGSLDITH